MRWSRRDWILLLSITLLGGLLRFYQIGAVPPGFQFDEAYNALDAEQVLAGNFPLFLPANGGREVLYTYFQAGLIWLFGSSPTVFRAASAIWGTLAVAATYLLLRAILRRNSRLMASFGALALAISYWHIHFSHYGIRVIMMPVIFSALFGMYWAATHAAGRRRRVLWALAAGVVLGLSVYANPTGRLAPFVLAAWTIVLLIRHPQERRLRVDSALGLLLVAGAAAFIVFIPLGMTFLRNPEFFFGHTAEVSIFAERVAGERSPLLLLADNILHVLGMFSFYGDLDWTHGMAGRPTLDWVISIPFLIGVVVWAQRLLRRRRSHGADGDPVADAGADPVADPDIDALWLLLLWVVVMLAPSVLSEAAPNYSRTLASLPASLLPVALGLTWIVARPWPAPALRWAAAGTIVAASLLITVRDYFVRFPQQTALYYAYDVDKLDALDALRARQATHQVYLSPLWAEHATLVYAREGSGIKMLDATDTVVLPPPGDGVGGAAYAFTPEEGAQADNFAARWDAPAVEVVNDRNGRPLLTLVIIDADTVQGWPPGLAPQNPMEVRFDDAPTLLGMQPVPPADGATTDVDSAGAIDLFWRAEAPTYRNLTSFIHLIDQEGNRVAQADRLPGNGSYQTPYWSPGERVIDRLQPTVLDPCAGGDSVRALVGWYEYAADNARRPRMGAPGDAVVAGTVTLPVLPLAAGAITPTIPLTQPLGAVTLLGYALQGTEALQPGAPFLLDLYLRAEEEVQALPARVALENTQGAWELAQTMLAPTVAMQPGDYFCQRLRLRAPADAREGTSALALALPTSGESVTMGPLIVRPSTHALTPVPFATPLDARFGNMVALAGVSVGNPAESTLPVEMVWQAVAPAGAAYVATLQLLAPDGALVAQSDAPPGGAPPEGRPTTQWVAGEYVVDTRTLVLPADVAAGEYKLVAALYDALSLERLPAATRKASPGPRGSCSWVRCASPRPHHS